MNKAYELPAPEDHNNTIKLIKSALSWLNGNIEKTVIILCYSMMTTIIFTEIIRRFVFSVQSPWSTSIPVLLFLWLTWVGAALNVKKRTHLSLNELRMRLPYTAQFACIILDAILWIVFAVIVIFFSYEQVYIAYDNYAIVQGTDDVMQWWFYLATPLGWSLIIFRVLQNLREDYLRFKRKESFLLQTSVMD
ncbi:TRAP transporter small permease [Photobacterium makurazakiensis]|uniref:TRAP transporter small permease n=1 Tax=Photobacterium makurazakiensis TaxID=2910234 RepID=UPI003D141DD8